MNFGVSSQTSAPLVCVRVQGVIKKNVTSVKFETNVFTIQLCFCSKLEAAHFFNGTTSPSWPGPTQYRDFIITLRRHTLVRTPLDEWSVRRSDLYLTTHNTHKRQTSMPLTGFEPAIPVSEQQQTATHMVFQNRTFWTLRFKIHKTRFYQS
jgi:hypothetical protein